MIRVSCHHCETAFKVPSSARGKKVKCPSCAVPLVVSRSYPVAQKAEPAVDFAALAAETSAPKSGPDTPRKSPRRGPLDGPTIWVIGGSLAAGLLLVAVLGVALVWSRWAASAPQPLAQAGPDTQPVVDVPATRPESKPEPKPEPVAEKPKEPMPAPEKSPEPTPEPVPEPPPPPPMPKEPEPGPPPVVIDAPPPPKAPPKPKTLSRATTSGLAYLWKIQMSNGAWAEGAEMENPFNPADRLPSVAHTSLASLAFLRAGASTNKGDYATRLTKAVEYVCSEVEKADKDSPYVTSNRNTYIQTKLGKYVDTYLALWLLAEVKGQMADDKANQRVDKALAKVIDKMKAHQLEDGSWDSEAVSPGLATGFAGKGMNRARQVGADVDAKVIEKAEKRGLGHFAMDAKPAAGGGIGVDLYTVAGNLGMVQDALGTKVREEYNARAAAMSPNATPADRAAVKAFAEARIKAEKDHQAAVEKIAKQLSDQNFLMPLGSYGGEEFMGFGVISESLLTSGSDEWAKWDRFVSDNLAKSQNRDGSWSGGHCLTGRTFCTAMAVLALTADRAPHLSAK